MVPEKRLLRCRVAAGFFLRGFVSAGPSSTTILLGGAGAATGAATTGCRWATCASCVPIACSSHAPSLPRPSSRPARADFKKVCVGGGTGQRGRLGNAEQDVVEGIDVAIHGERGESAPGPLPAASALVNRSGSVVLRSRCMELTSCCELPRTSFGAFQRAMLMLPIAVCTLASAGRRFANGEGAGAAGV